MPTYEDIAFKVIVKNDGISDIIFKTLMLKGEAGGTISSIEKTSSVGVVDTYTITLNDGTTTTFEVTNGSNIASIEKTATAGLIDTYTVTLTNGDTSTFEVKNGEDAQLYELPKDCVVGYDKEPTQTTVTSSERYIQLDDVNGISSVKYNGSTLQATNDGRNLANFNDGEPKTDTISSNFYEATLNKGTLNELHLEAGVTYTLSMDVTSDVEPFYITVGAGNGNYLADIKAETNLTSGRVSCTFTPTANNLALGDIFCFRAPRYTNTTSFTFTVDKLQLEKNSQATPYQPYCGGIPAPNPDYPKEIVGVGEKQQDNTYSVDLVAEDADGNVYTVTASGLSYPVYAGDWIDLVAGKLHRANGYDQMTYSYLSGLNSDYIGYLSNISQVGGHAVWVRNWHYQDSAPKRSGGISCKCNAFARISMNDSNIIATQNRIYFGVDNIESVADFLTAIQNLENSGNGLFIAYELAEPTEEDITLTGDLEQVKRIRGEYVYIDAPLYASTDITFGQETDFPDGYEEIDFPLDDMFYYQDQEYIEFPTSWGFVMGYVFDANEIRFTMNVTKDLKEGFNVVANKSVDLALNLYTGSGGSNLTGFNFVDASFIREYGQIQIRLKTENPHGLTVGSLLGARVSQGRLRITFEEEEEE